MMAMMLVLLGIFTFYCCPPSTLAQQKRKPHRSAATSSKSIVVRTEVNATVWLDEVRRGVTGANGELMLTNIAPRSHTLRVRADGFKERSIALRPAQRGAIKLPLVRTNDEAELVFQQAEKARESARDDAARREAEKLYARALKLRPAFPQAHTGRARALFDLNEFDAALDEINAARKNRPIYPEASAIEGRILREQADTQGALKAFARAIREAHGVQPEAHTGLARIYEEQGRYEDAASKYRAALGQLADTEPVIYQLLGAVYEKMGRYKEAIAAYEKYLQLAPNGSYAAAVRSIIDQLRRQAAGETLTPK